MKKCVAFFLALLLLAAMLAACASKQRDVYYGDVKLEYVEEAYEPDEIWLDNEWLQRKSREAAEGLNLSKTKDLLTYLGKIDPLINRYFCGSNYAVTGIVHFSNGVWGLRFVYDNPWPALDACDKYYYFRETDGEIINTYRDWYDENPWKDFLDY